MILNLIISFIIHLYTKDLPWILYGEFTGVYKNYLLLTCSFDIRLILVSLCVCIVKMPCQLWIHYINIIGNFNFKVIIIKLNRDSVVNWIVLVFEMITKFGLFKCASNILMILICDSWHWLQVDSIYIE